MKKIAVFTFMALLIVLPAKGQDQKQYHDLVSEARELYNSGDYHASGKKYADAFVALGGKGYVNDRFNAACSWALAGEVDSAFSQLTIIAEKGNYSNLTHLTTNPDLISLYEDERWLTVIEKVKANKEKEEENLDQALVAVLDTIYHDDQVYRKQLRAIEEKYGRDSDEMKALRRTIVEKDSVNQVKVKKILDEHGWLGADVIGHQGNRTLFLVIQHADQETQEKYLPMMREAVKSGNAWSGSLALLEDRVALGRGEKQIYGSQVGRNRETGEYYVLPLTDPDHVDERRAEVGLGPLQDYLMNWGIIWDVEAYKIQLLADEAK